MDVVNLYVQPVPKADGQYLRGFSHLHALTYGTGINGHILTFNISHHSSIRIGCKS
jgi:hypothetical protein